MTELTFEDLKEICKKNVERKYVAECLEVIQNNDCVFVPVSRDMSKNKKIKLNRRRWAGYCAKGCVQGYLVL